MALKRVFCLFIALFLVMFAACDSKAPVETTQATETTEAKPLQVEYHCPWQYDVCQQAKQDGKLHYYFMSSEGLITKEGIPSKWGDCCLMVFPDGQTMLIDSGVAGYGPVLAENLQRMGVKRLDYVVISHPHSDHKDGIFHEDNMTGSGVLDLFEIGQVYHRGGSDAESVKIKEGCDDYSISLDVLEKGDTLQIGQVNAQVLWPLPGTSAKKITGTANINNSSVVVRFDFGAHSSLFTGDLYDDGEFALMSSQDTAIFDADLLKAPHHGGYTSSSEVFLGIVSPELTVATGFEGIRDDVMNRYAGTKTPIIDDRTYGYIHVSTDGNTMTWESSREEPLIFLTDNQTVAH